MIQDADVTGLLRQAQGGDAAAAQALMRTVYAELRLMARRYMRRERQGHTLQATELVNEAYLKLVRQEGIEWKDRAHFFATAATLMRRILVDHARKRLTGKRGEAAIALPLLDNLAHSPERDATLLELDDALRRLHQSDPRSANVVELRFFGGLDEVETAKVLGIAERTVRRDWTFARAWLREELRVGSAHAKRLG